MRKMLIGIHDKNCSGRAVTYVMKHHANSTNLDITFVHVFPNLPAMYWDDGHLLNSKEKQERKRVIDTWIANERDYIEPIIQGAMKREMLFTYRATIQSWVAKFPSYPGNTPIPL